MHKASTRGQPAVAFRVLLATVLLAPLPFASVYPWGWGTVAVITGLLVCWWSVAAFRDPTRISVGLGMIWPAAAGVAVVVIWAILQMMNWTPPSWHHPLWRETIQALDAPYRGSISLNPQNTGDAVIRFTTYAGIFWLSLQYCRSSANALLAVRSLSIAGVIYASYGLVIFFTGNHTILFLEKWAYADDLTSVFVNRNNYATYAGLGALCVAALFLRSFAQWTRNKSTRTERVLRVLKFFEHGGWIYLLAILVMAAALLLTHSRGGLVSTAVGFMSFCGTLFATKSYAKATARHFALVTVTLGLIFFLASGQGVGQRLAETDMASEERPLVYAATLEAIDGLKYLGGGYGSFEDIFRLYRTNDIMQYFAEAHNTYLESALELGIAPAAGVLLAALYLFILCLKGSRSRERDVIYPCLGIGATALVGVHAIVDFSVQIPAVAATYAMLMGIACAQSWSSRRDVG